MKLTKLLKIIVGLLIFLVVAIALTSIKHPIILKWVTGSARHHGQPMPATVYTNGRVNDNIKVFYTDEENSYLLKYDSLEMLKFININLNEEWIGIPVVGSKIDYDVIAGHLFQSEAGRRFSHFQEAKGFNFDPQLSFNDRQIKFNMPPNRVKFDSVRIELP